tara:strand:- start:6529 stop:8931 length:2403 start_codon:yes stop_codon:yes gene_type:complete
MATTVDTLLIELKAETKNLRKGLDGVNKKLGATEKKSKSVSKTLKTVGGALATLGGAAVIGNIATTVRKFEDLEATLRAVTKSSEAAATAFELIRKFTAQTTFQVDEVATAFITLKQAGIVPTSEVLRDFGNFAAGMGKSITQLAQAAFNATTGEMEMLKQFGVIARQQGDKITVTFDGVTKEIERSGFSVIQYLRSIGRENFSDAIEQRANTLTGAVSNLQDAFAEFQVQIGDGGLRSALTDISKGLKSVLENNMDVAHAIGTILGGALRALAFVITLVLDNFKLLVTFLAVRFLLTIKMVTVTTALSTINFNRMTISLNAATAAFGRLTIAARRNIIALGITAAAGGLMWLFSDSTDEATDSIEDLDEELNKMLGSIQDVSILLSSTDLTNFNLFKDIQGQALAAGKSIQDLINEDFKGLAETLNNVRNLEVAKSIVAMSPEDRAKIMVDRMYTPKGMKTTFIGDTDIATPFEDLTETEIFDLFRPDGAFADLASGGFMSAGGLGGLSLMNKGFTDLNDILNTVDITMFGVHETQEDYIAWLQSKPFEFLLNDMEKGILDLARSTVDETEIMKDAWNGLTDEAIIDLHETIKQFLPESLQDIEDFTAAVDLSFQEQKDEAKGWSESLQDAVETASHAFTSDLVNALAEGQKGLDAFKDFCADLAKQIITIFLKMSVVNPILNSIFDLSGDDAFTTFWNQGKASGGKVQRRTPYLIGERGPEIFVPDTGGSVLNNMNAKNAMGGGAVIVNQSVNFATGVVPTVRAEVLSLMPQIADVTKAAVVDSASRSGRMRGVLSNA